MTKTLTDTLNLPTLEEALKGAKESRESQEDIDLAEQEAELEALKNEEPLETVEAVTSALEKSQKLSQNILDLQGKDSHDSEMDDISVVAMEGYQQMLDLGLDSSPAHSGKMFESAVQLLRVSLDAKNSKTDKKLKILKLQLDQAKFERQLGLDNGGESVIESEGVISMDRNALLQAFKEKVKDD